VEAAFSMDSSNIFSLPSSLLFLYTICKEDMENSKALQK